MAERLTLQDADGPAGADPRWPDIHPLLRTLDFGGQFSLHFALCDSPEVRSRIIAAVRASPRGQYVDERRLDHPVPSLYRVLRSDPPMPDASAVFVYGLESWIGSVVGPEGQRFIVGLNHFREGFRTVLHCPLVIWLPRYLLPIITDLAPDFVSVRTSTYDFTEPAPETWERAWLDARSGVDSSTADERRSVLAEIESLLARSPGPGGTGYDPRARARQLADAGGIRFDLADYDIALKYFQESLAIMRETGDRQGEAAALNNISQVYEARGEYDKALEYLEQSLARRESSDRRGKAVALINISQIYKARSDYDKTLDSLQQALAITNEVGDREGQAAALNSLATLSVDRGEDDKALDYLQEALAIQRAIRDRQGEAATLNNTAQISAKRQHYDEAQEYLQQSLAIRREIGDRPGEATVLNNLASVSLSRGNYNHAMDLLQQALVIQREIGDRPGMCPTLFNIGRVHMQKQQVSDVNTAWVQSYRIAREIGLAPALDALDKLAKQLGETGLDYWERLASSQELSAD